jgi:LDH2 family malate/lactate/ureidoglycolate dehydrogenase
VLFPGEHEQRTAQERSRDGIYVEDKTWAALHALDQV